MDIIQSHLQQNPKNVALNQLASKVKLLMDGGMTKENFHAIVAVVKQTINVMGMEQKEDDGHLSWCNSEIAQCEEKCELEALCFALETLSVVGGACVVVIARRNATSCSSRNLSRNSCKANEF